MWPQRGGRDDILAVFVTWTSFAWDVFGLCAVTLCGSQLTQDPTSNKFKFWFCELCTNLFPPSGSQITQNSSNINGNQFISF